MVRQEALAWHKGALRAMEDASWRGQHLLLARGWVLVALVAAVFAMSGLVYDRSDAASANQSAMAPHGGAGASCRSCHSRP
jgi:hypothetical protein